MNTYLILILVQIMCFTISAMKIKIDSIPIASACNILPLVSHPPDDFVKCNPSAIDSTKPKLIWCICFIYLSNTGTKYPFLLCALSTSMIVVVILKYFLWFGANLTNSIRSPIHTGWFTNSCSNNSGGPSNILLSIFSSASSSLYILPPAY